MKEFYKIANKVLMIRTNNLVVHKLKQVINGEEETIKDRALVLQQTISKKFTWRPDYMQSHNEVDEEMNQQNSGDENMIVDTTEIFRLTDIVEATKSSNFNKGIGLYCFDGNILQVDSTLATGSPLKSKIRSTRGKCLGTLKQA